MAAVAALGLAACGSSSHSHTRTADTAALSPGTATGTASATSTGAQTTTPTATGASAGTRASGGDLARFKADIVDAQRSGRALGPQLTATLEHAGKMTAPEIARRFTALSRKVAGYANSVSHFPAPPQFESEYRLVVEGFHSVAGDLASIAKLASQHAGTAAGKVAIEKLYAELQALSSAETALDKAVGLSS